MGAAEIGWLDATAPAELIRTRQVSAVEVVQQRLERIDGIDPRLNSVVTVLADQALAAAGAADEAVAAVAHDATTVARMRAAGGLVLAKTSLSEFSYWTETDNLLVGRADNPSPFAGPGFGHGVPVGRVSGMTDSADLALAHRLADQADEIARRYFRAPHLGTEDKDDGSPVTEADRAIERALRASIRTEHPSDAFVGEEFGAHGRSSRRWIMDAIDGTASFIAGEPEWSTLIALEEHGVVTLGMVSAPALGRRWWAMPGTGAWMGPCPFDPSVLPRRLILVAGGNAKDAAIGIWPPPPRLSETERAIAARLAAGTATVLPALDWSTADPTAPPPRKPSTGSGSCHGALLVATGKVDAFLLLGAGPWDIAAVIPIVEEAGGTFSDLSGQRRTDTGAALFAGPGLHQQLLNMAKSPN
ncbi:inositol monophosphatase family protein [Streptomyces sp. NPDC050508]|uniref:inositol monophosphatase family protein n=1 Tax=Streptomyces sp. NPDC050508 TaxID=3155405 RepID=UPI003423B589